MESTESTLVAELAPPLTAALVRGPEAIAALRDEWEGLLARAERPAVFQGPDWLATWWRFLGRGELRLVLVRDAEEAGGTLIGVVPLQVRRVGVPRLRLRLVRWLGYGRGALTDTLGPVFAAGRETEAARAALACLRRNADEWDMLDLARTPVELAATVRDWGQESGYRIHVFRSIDWLYIRLADDWSSLQRTLSKNLRSNLPRYRNRLRREGHSEHFQVLTDPDAIAAALPRFFELHRLRAQATDMKWHSDYFATPASQRFLAEITRHLSARGRLALAQLQVDGSVVAAQLLLFQGRMMTTYFSGFDPEWRQYSVMLLTTKGCVEYAIERGLRWVDLTAGAGSESQTKRQWGNELAHTKHIMVIRRSLVGALAEWGLQKWYIIRRLRMWSHEQRRRPLWQMATLPADEELHQQAGGESAHG